MLEFPRRISLCGFGGQGIILSAVILGTVSVTKENLFAVQTQSYGSEARGGQCQAELIIDKVAIQSPIAEKKNLLISMFQAAYDKYIDVLEDDGVLIVDSQLVSNLHHPVKNTFAIPATQIAVDLGVRMAANMVVLGFACECLGLLELENLKEVVADNVPERFRDVNMLAVEKGAQYAKDNNLYW